MPRRLRIDVGGIVYHVLNRRVGRMTLFEEDEDFAAFEKVLDEAHQRIPMRWLSNAIVAAAVVAMLSISLQATMLPVVRQFPTPGDGPSGLTFVDDNLWLWDADEPDLFYVLDPNDGSVISSYPTPPTGGPTGLAYDGQYVYGVSGYGSEYPYFAKFSPTDGSVIEYLDLPVASPTGITFGNGYLWVSETDGYQIVKIDPITMQVIQSLTKGPYFSRDLAWDGQTLWLGALDDERKHHYLYQIDPATGDTLNIFEVPGKSCAGLVCSDDLLYISDSANDMVYVLSIPEPATIGFLLLGLVLMCGNKRCFLNDTVA